MWLQSSFVCIIFAVTIIFGGAVSTANAVNVKQEYMERFNCDYYDDIHDDDNDPFGTFCKHLCHKLEQLRNCQAASAVSFRVETYVAHTKLMSYVFHGDQSKK